MAEDVERGLQAVALCSGNTRRAEELLADQDCRIPRSTLKSWKSAHPDRYARIEAEVIPRIYERVAQANADLEQRYAEVEREMVDELRGRVGELRPAELPGALRNVATSRAISTDKLLLLRDKPTQIVEQRSGQDILRKLQQLAPGLVVDGTAEVISEEANSSNGE